jgi:hypothetical protein
LGVLALLAVMTGCAGNVTQTSRQLKEGEIIVSAVADIPGAWAVPKLSGNVAYGIGDIADVNATLGTALFSYSAGAGVRVYPTDFLTLSAQGNFTLYAGFGSGESINILGGTFRATTATKRFGKIPVYGGLQALVTGIAGRSGEFFEFDGNRGDDLRFLSFNAGLVFGFETDISDSWDFQFDLAFMPLGTTGAPDAKLGLFPVSVTSITPFMVQTGFALHYGVGRGGQVAPPSEPPAEPPRDATPAPPAEPSRVAPTPTPTPAPRPADTRPPADGPEAVPVP